MSTLRSVLVPHPICLEPVRLLDAGKAASTAAASTIHAATPCQRCCRRKHSYRQHLFLAVGSPRLAASARLRHLILLRRIWLRLLLSPLHPNALPAADETPTSSVAVSSAHSPNTWKIHKETTTRRRPASAYAHTLAPDPSHAVAFVRPAPSSSNTVGSSLSILLSRRTRH